MKSPCRRREPAEGGKPLANPLLADKEVHRLVEVGILDVSGGEDAGQRRAGVDRVGDLRHESRVRRIAAANRAAKLKVASAREEFPVQEAARKLVQNSSGAMIGLP